MKLIRISDAKDGMILSRDIINEMSGTAVLTKGTVLNKSLIKRVKNLNIYEIYIIDQSQYELAKQRKDKDRTEIFLYSHNQLADKVRRVFDNVKIGKEILLSEISAEADDIICELFESDNILSRLRQIKEDDDYTFKHSINVSILATMVGKWLKLSKKDIKQLFLAGLFHDIGKLKISTDIINKPSELNEKETNTIRRHPLYGYEILSNTVGISEDVLFGVLQHHEREDGSGYPNGLKGDKIHQFAKIIAVCDIFDAMTSERIYKEKVSPFKVAEQIANDSFGKLDAKISLVFLKNISNFYVGNTIKLNTGETGEIIYIYKTDPTRPVVKVGTDFYDLSLDRSLDIIDVLS
ncbi:HD-GYP domain-containing protein [Clostridiaceae bacterium M8S5]|nr:HD-GYP domain-containing protein [Clostridiaceae bacterium M8S5]